jgi:ribokinase
MTRPPRILVFASINLDFTLRIDRLPRPGETLLTETAFSCPGGKGANQTVAAKRLGAHVGIVCCVGDDLPGRAVRRAVEFEGIEIIGWHVEPKLPTAIASISVLPDGKNAIVVASGANRAMTPDHVKVALESDSNWDAALITLETPLTAVEAAVRETHARNIPLLIDAGGNPKALRGDLAVIQPNVTLTANESELAAITGAAVTDPAAAERAAAASGFTQLLCKLGDNGSSLKWNAAVTHEPAFPIHAIDTVAAGDAHSAAFVVAWAERIGDAQPEPAAVRDVLRFANAAGALACTQSGAFPAMPFRRDVDLLTR